MPPAPHRPLDEIYPARGGEPCVRRLELLQLCTDIDDADVAAMVDAVRSGRPDDYREISRRSEERRRLRGERSAVDVDEALAELAKRGYRPADAREFLCFLAQYPHRQRRHHDIIALGSVHRVQDEIFVLEIFDRPYQREYELVFLRQQSRWSHSWWLSHHRFLASRLVP